MMAEGQHDLGVTPEATDDKADAELAAMSAVKKALAGLDDDSRERVFDWVLDYYGYAPRRRTTPPGDNRGRTGDTGRPSDNGAAGQREQQPQSYSDFAALYHAANPQTEAERALVGGYWFQVAQARDTNDFGSAEVNKALNQLGFGIGNITARINDLINLTPAPVIQLRKSGKAQQARKRYRVTDQGIRRVQRMLTTGNTGEEE